MSENERRKALNEVVFREVNERIEALQSSFAVAERLPLNLVCECDRLDCAEQISVPVELYEKVRSDAALFFVRPGHEDESIEDVVDTGGDYMIVRKRPGDPQEIAERTDPRA
ncbi:MAG: hypothetical protein ACTHKS_06540 [Gaiellaceae bacterium]